MTRELNDLSGPFDPTLTFQDLSKEFLLKIMEVWQFAWIHMATAFYDVAREKYGIDAANQMQLEAWTRVGDKVNPRYPKIANIEMKTVLDSLKAAQLPLDNTMGNLYKAQYEIINENHVILTIPQCRSLRYYEREAPEMIDFFCHQLEVPMMQRYYINPKLTVKPLKVPPRSSPEEIACQWELKIEE